jgi:hypothetical protein
LPQSVRNRKAPSGKGPKGKRENEKSKAKDSSKGQAKDVKELRVSEVLGEGVEP